MAISTSQHLLELARRLQRVATYGELLATATDEMRQRTRFRNSWLSLFDFEAGHLDLLAGIGEASLENIEQADLMQIPLGDDPMIDEMIASSKPVVVVDARTDPRTRKDRVAQMDNRTIVNIPLLFDHEALGAFGFGTFGPEGVMAPTDEELAYLTAMASHLSVVISRLRADERRRNVEAQLQRAQRLDAMGKLAGGVAHDFNNLLTAVLGNVELARLEDDLPASLQPYLDDIDGAASRASALSRQLLAFARRQVVQARPVNVNDILGDLQPMLRRLVPETTAIEVLAGKSLGTVLADPGQLDQVMVNLVLNAKDAMPDGGRLVIETENVLIDEAYRESNPWARTGRFVLLTVTDSGVGMSEEVRAQIFEPFFTTKAPDEGTGLGLSVVFGIVQQHDGLVRVYSEPDFGTTFKIYLPIVERAATSVGTKIERPVQGGSEHVLVAEDDERVRRVVRGMLAQAGYRVSVAEDGAQALALCAGEDAPDLVVSDMVMPNLDGAALWKALEKQGGIPVLIMSGYAANGLASRFEDHSDLVVLSKPFRSQELLRLVRRLLDAPTP